MNLVSFVRTVILTRLFRKPAEIPPQGMQHWINSQNPVCNREFRLDNVRVQQIL